MYGDPIHSLAAGFKHVRKKPDRHGISIVELCQLKVRLS